MLSQATALLRAALALKTRQLKLAIRSYLGDRVDQGKNIVTAYVVAGVFLVCGAVFFVATCFVGVIALYRWIALWQGQFIAFGGVAGLLALLALICVAVAVAQIRRPAKPISGLSRRLATAIQTRPAHFSRPPFIEGARQASQTRHVAGDTRSSQQRPEIGGRPHRANDGRLLLLAGATLLGWVIARRH